MTNEYLYKIYLNEFYSVIRKTPMPMTIAITMKKKTLLAMSLVGCGVKYLPALLLLLFFTIV